MSEIPSSWTWSTIGELSKYIQRGKSPKYTEYSDLPVINQKCIRWNQLELKHLKYIHPEQFPAWDKARYISPGDILWNSTGTGTVGRAYLIKQEDCTHPKVVDSHVTIVRPVSIVDPRYLFNWIKGPQVQDKIEEMCDGTTNQIELSRTAIATTPIPLAPAAEQIRIANQLDTLLARVQTCNDRIGAIPDLVKRFRQSILTAATSVEFSEIPLAEGNSAKPLKEVLLTVRTGPFGSALHKSDYVTNGVPVINPTHIRGGRLVPDPRMSVSDLTAHHLSEFRLKSGDVIIGRRGEMGRCAVVGELENGWLCGTGSMILRPAENLNPFYLQFFLSSPSVVAALEEASVGSTMSNLNQKILLNLEIVVPSIDVQLKMVRRAEDLFRLADRIETYCNAARTKAQRLTPLLIEKAFRGELVPQDPNEEPVSALLERIAAEQATADTQPLRRQSKTVRKITRNPKDNAAMTKSRQDDDVQGKPYLTKHLRLLGGSATAEVLFKASELPVADFYKQLAWELGQGYLRDGKTVLELANAA